MNLLSIYTGYVLDLIIGDPYSFPHPVRYIGKLISIVEKQIRKITSSDKGLKIAGFFLWFIVVGATFGITTLVLQLFKFNKLAYFIVNTILIYTTLATKCLKDESVKIYKVLKTGDLEKSRIQLSYIVGRDTTNLNEKEIVRATVETVAENTVDGIITNSESAVDIIIKPLVERYQDKSCNNAKTFGRVYKNMRTSRSWKLLLSRRKCRTKKELIESDRKLMK